jgi:hypothetical protein
MDHRGQSQHHRAPPSGSAFAGDHRKKNEASLLTEWERIWQRCQREVCGASSCAERLRQHLLAHLICPGRHTVSGLITVLGGQFKDWTADYSLYSKDRVDADVIFNEVRMVPISFEEASTPRKPRKGASEQVIEAYKEQMKQRNLNALAVKTLAQLQQQRAKVRADFIPNQPI